MKEIQTKTLMNVLLFSAKSGLTEAELEDILSCDDDILNDVYMYWEPPVRRLPPLLFVRLKADLSQYLGRCAFLVDLITDKYGIIFIISPIYYGNNCVKQHSNALANIMDNVKNLQQYFLRHTV